MRPDVELLTATLGRVGLEMIGKYRPDLVLLDMHLPDIPGTEVLDEIRTGASTAALPVIVVSADATQHQVDDVLRRGADDYVTKPVRVKTLLSAIDRTLDSLARRSTVDSE